MLKPHSNPLPDQSQAQFKAWLAAENFRLLVRIVEGKAIRLAAEAVNNAVESDEGNQFDAKAMGNVMQARRYRHFLEVLKEISTDKTHETITIETSPTK